MRGGTRQHAHHAQSALGFEPRRTLSGHPLCRSAESCGRRTDRGCVCRAVREGGYMTRDDVRQTAEWHYPRFLPDRIDQNTPAPAPVAPLPPRGPGSRVPISRPPEVCHFQCPDVPFSRPIGGVAPTPVRCDILAAPSRWVARPFRPVVGGARQGRQLILSAE